MNTKELAQSMVFDGPFGLEEKQNKLHQWIEACTSEGLEPNTKTLQFQMIDIQFPLMANTLKAGDSRIDDWLTILAALRLEASLEKFN